MFQWLKVRRWALFLLVASLAACGGGGGGGSSTGAVVVSPAEAPVARISASGVNADGDGAMRGGVNGLITFDASSSTAASGSVQSYAWVLNQMPAASKASLSGLNQKVASFTPDVPGKYQVTLTVSSSGGQSVNKTLDLLIAEAPPVANIVVSAVYTGATAPAQVAPIDATVGSVFTLDSSQLKAADGSAV
ncbi:MAG: hypothetical protein O9341_14910, partial [Paucibacter sp.]|nr:hypothetical protein [Roseateles sp.]